MYIHIIIHNVEKNIIIIQFRDGKERQIYINFKFCFNHDAILFFLKIIYY